MAYTDREDLNYLGTLRLIGQYKTPFFTMISGRAKTKTSFLFPIAQPYSLQAASQNTQSEATAAAAGTPTTTTRAQDTNTCQIMKYDYEVSIAKESTTGEISGISITGEEQPVQSESAFQRDAQFRQMGIDIEYSFFQGTYTAPSLSSTNQKTRGIVTATTTNAVAAGGADLSKALIDELLRTMAATGSLFQDCVIMVNAFQKQQISDIYGYAPTSRNVGGLNIQQIETDFGMFGVAYAPQMPTDTLLIAEVSVCYPVFVPVKARPGIPGGIIVDVPTSITAAKSGGYWYTQVGLDYGPEEYHGKITGLSTS